MAEIVKKDPKKAANELVRIGKAWIKQTAKGDDYIAICIDKEQFAAFAQLTIKPGDCIMVFGNQKRPDKDDADYTVHLVNKIAE